MKDYTDIRKEFKDQTGKESQIPIIRNENNTQFNWEYVKWLEDMLIKSNTFQDL